jgi:hypothetical protein
MDEKIELWEAENSINEDTYELSKAHFRSRPKFKKTLPETKALKFCTVCKPNSLPAFL